jgi:hypothetical protein
MNMLPSSSVNAEDKSRMFFRNFGTHQEGYTAQQPRRRQPENIKKLEREEKRKQ